MTFDFTITSKNQITLPAKIVRQMNLQKNRILTLDCKNDKIIMTPKPSLEAAMKKYWTKHKATKPISDEDLRDFTRLGMAKKVAESL